MKKIYLPMLICLCIIPNIFAKKITNPNFNFINYTQKNNFQKTLQTAVLSFISEKKVKVSLFSAIHMADKAYYQNITRMLDNYDTVLFEGIKKDETHSGKNTKPYHVFLAKIPNPNKTKSSNLDYLFKIQKDITSKLGLHFQTNVIDYTKQNFVHADLTVNKMQELNKSRKESFTVLLIRAFQEQNSQNQKIQKKNSFSLNDLMLLVSDKSNNETKKDILAKKFNDINYDMLGLNGKNGSVILTERNKIVIQKLQEQIKAGKKSIAILYGAAHMPDLKKRLLKLKFKILPNSLKWLDAWKINLKNKNGTHPQ